MYCRSTFNPSLTNIGSFTVMLFTFNNFGKSIKSNNALFNTNYSDLPLISVTSEAICLISEQLAGPYENIVN